MARASEAARRRMAGPERRKQLLDVAAAAVGEVGMTGLTMERLAERADVSKALPYQHFESIDAVLLAVYEREAVRLGRYVWNELESTPPGADLVTVHVRAYFDGVAASGAVIQALTAPGSTLSSRAGSPDDGPRFTSRVLHRFHGVPRSRSEVIAHTLHPAILGAGQAWRRGLASREELVDCTIHLVRAAIAWEAQP